MSVRKLLLYIAFYLTLCSSAFAMTIDSPVGYSTFTVTSINEITGDIGITATMTSLEASFVMTFDDDFSDDGIIWQITMTLTNGSTIEWTKASHEAYVPLDSGYDHSCDFDGVSFDQGDAGRIITSTTFDETAIADETGCRDFIVYVGGFLSIGATDTQSFPITASVSTCLPCVDLGPGTCFNATNCNPIRVTQKMYTGTQCYEIIPISYNFEDISVTGTCSTDLSGTAGNFVTTTSPFPIFLYDTALNYKSGDPRLRWCAVGLLYPQTASSSCPTTNVDLTSSDPSDVFDEPYVIPLWDNWSGSSCDGGSRTTCWQILGDIPNRRFIIQWDRVCPSNATDPVSFQTVLYEDSHNIDVQYRDVTTDVVGRSNGGSATVGIRSINGNALCTISPDPEGCQMSCVVDGSPTGCGEVNQYSFNQAIVSDETAIRFQAVSCAGTGWGWTHRP